ncbi:MAG: hypothetical protein H6742_05660 [Alphaproteobacteria bacterium]|nr:hypothetical protein [Alphaproteobacteria bacterium]
MIALSLLLLACPKTESKSREPRPVLEVETVSVTQRGEQCRFDGDRPWVVSLHEGVVSASDARALEQAIVDGGLAGQVVFDWFGSAAPERVEVELGRDLPVALAAAIVEMSGGIAERHTVALSAGEEQGDTCRRSRAYVGALMPTDAPVIGAAQLRTLSEIDDAARFWAQVPVAN